MKLTNRRGTMLIAAYLVLFVIIIVVTAIFSVVIHERKEVERNAEELKALNFAEMGLAYAYFESQNLGWQWYTHKWNAAEDTLVPLEATDPQYQIQSRTDCHFDADGFYAADDGTFTVKSYPSATVEGETIVVALGISGNYRKAIMYNLSRQGIYDFFYFSPYDIRLDYAVGNYPKLNGGGIHTNQNIYFVDAVRLENISELSTGNEGRIYYAEAGKYLAPHYADDFDNARDGKAPIVRLDNYTNVFRDDTKDDPGPFGYYYLDKYNNRQWGWKSNATLFAPQDSGRWPYSSYYNNGTTAYLDTEYKFYGNNQPWYNVKPGKYDPQVSSSIKNDSAVEMNRYNVWIKPYLGQTDKGAIISDVWKEIPAELDQPWNWQKYAYVAGGEQPITFYTYNDDGEKVDVEDTYWGIDTVTHEDRWPVPDEWWDFYVKMFSDPRFGGGGPSMVDSGSTTLDYDTHEIIYIWDEQTFAMIDPDELGDHPEAKNYWDMYKSPEYWAKIYKYPSYPYTWPEYLDDGIFDGTYGDEISSGGKIGVKHTNSTEQPEAWKSFLQASGLDNIVRDGNTGGKDLTPPEFDVTYSNLAERDGIYIGLAESFDGEFSDYDEWIQVMEKSVDAAAAGLNEGEGESGKIAQKVKFINTYTGKWNVVLEIDLDKMQEADKYPNNGIIYTQVPIRFTNAEKLPRKMANYGFTVMGEENIYLKGDFNVDEWVTAAVVSKKRVFTLSDDFNDPQNKPATGHYRDYPYLYIKDNGAGAYVESNPELGGGMWVYRDNLNHPTTEYYPLISSENELALKNIIIQKDAAYLSMFDKKDTTGAATDTFTWPASGESYTYAMMPNTVSKSHTYNCLIAANRDVKGYSLERWGSKSKYLNGSFFILESTGFTAPYRSLVDYEPGTGTGAKDLPYDNRSRLAPGSTYDYVGYAVSAPYAYLSYDARFKTAARSPSDVFFGGAQSLWMESTPEFFYQMSF